MIHLRGRQTAHFSRCILCMLYLLLAAQRGMAAFTSEPRWGQATAVINNVLFVHGGKTDGFNEYSYTSAPTSNDLFLLDLSQNFDPSSPPWQYISGSANTSSPQGQDLAWHTLSAYNTTELLLFGGDGGPNSPIVLPSQSNSAELLDISSITDPIWAAETEGWAEEPSRRIHHSTASTGGNVYLVGGEKDDGSSLGYSDHYIFNPNTPSFTRLPTSNGPPDIYGHASVVLSDGRMLVIGGFSESVSQLIPFTTIWSMDTTQSTLSWSTESVSSNAVPTGRRAFACVWLEGDQVLIHGGSDADFQTSYSDGWILDTTTSPMTWSNVSALTAIGARRDHFAVQVGSQILFGFGYGINAGASVEIIIFDVSSNSITTSFSPQSTPSHTTLPVASGTNAPSSGSSSSGMGSSHGSGSGGTPGSDPTGNSSGGSWPTGTNGGSPGSSSGSDTGARKKHDTTVIAVASVVGALVVAAAVVCFVVIVIRRKYMQQQFYPLQGDDPESPARPSRWELAGFALLPRLGARRGAVRGEKARMAGQGDLEGWTVLGIGRRNADADAPRERIDMLANEDASEFADIGRHGRLGSGSSKSWYSLGAGSAHEQYPSTRPGRPSIGRLVSGSLGSLRNVGVGVKRVISGSGARVLARQVMDVSLPWDPYDESEDSDGLLLHDKSNRYSLDPLAGDDLGAPVGAYEAKKDSPAARPRGGRLESSETSKYSDPFKDQDEQITIFDVAALESGQDRPGSSNRTPGPDEDDALSFHSTFSRSPVTPHLTPLITTALKNSSDNPSYTSLFASSTGGHTTSSSSQQPISPLSTTSVRPQTTSIIGTGSTSAPSFAVKRSDSWWTRFRRVSLRDGALEQAKARVRARVGSVSGMGAQSVPLELDFRDPNPPPVRLGAIKEASGSSGGNVGLDDALRANAGAGEVGHIYSKSGHERSTTSLRTSQTADSAVLERLAGRVDVVQREATGTSVEGGYSPSPSLIGGTNSSGKGGLRVRRSTIGTWSSVTSGSGSSGSIEARSEHRSPSPSLDSLDKSQDIVDGAASVFVDESHVLAESPTAADLLISSAPEVARKPKPSFPQLSTSTSTPSTPLSATAKDKRPAPSGKVAERIAEYERRMTPISPSPSNPSSPGTAPLMSLGTRKRDGEQPRRKSNSISVKYGLVQRPALFVANPDSR